MVKKLRRRKLESSEIEISEINKLKDVINNRYPTLIYLIRKKYKLRQKDLAKLLGTTQSNVSKIQNGQASPTADLYVILLLLFNNLDSFSNFKKELNRLNKKFGNKFS